MWQDAHLKIIDLPCFAHSKENRYRTASYQYAYEDSKFSLASNVLVNEFRLNFPISCGFSVSCFFFLPTYLGVFITPDCFVLLLFYIANQAGLQLCRSRDPSAGPKFRQTDSQRASTSKSRCSRPVSITVRTSGIVESRTHSSLLCSDAWNVVLSTQTPQSLVLAFMFMQCREKSNKMDCLNSLLSGSFQLKFNFFSPAKNEELTAGWLFCLIQLSVLSSLLVTSGWI